jgi:tRNA 2-thiouridine synthesizing protein C
MTVIRQKSLLVVVRHSPYGSSLARASLDVALAAAAFDQPVSLLFAGDGVLQLLPGQDCTSLGVKSLGKLLASLPLYGIEQVNVDAEAAELYGLTLEDSPVKARALDREGMSQLVHCHDHVLGF